MRVGKNAARLCAAASVASVLLGSSATAQEQMQEVEAVEIVYRSCYERTKYIYDGFVAYPMGTETVCTLLLSNGRVITVVGDPIQT